MDRRHPQIRRRVALHDAVHAAKGRKHLERHQHPQGEGPDRVGTDAPARARGLPRPARRPVGRVFLRTGEDGEAPSQIRTRLPAEPAGVGVLPDAERHVPAPDELVGHQREAGGDAPPAPGHPHRALAGEAADPGTSERAAGATCEIIRPFSEVTMARYRNALPQLDGRLFLTDGGIETTLIFHEGLALPDFAAFDLLKTADGTASLRKYFRTYAEIAKRFGTGLILESATWRASSDWGARLGYSPDAL